MSIKSKVGALVGAGLLTFAVAGVALATDGAWAGNGFPGATCTADTTPATMYWIWTGDSPTALTINGEAQSGSWVQNGGGSSSYHFVVTVDGVNWTPTKTNTFVTYTGAAGELTLSHCDGGTAPTPAPTPSPSPSPTLPTISGAGDTNSITQPPTDTELGNAGTSGPSDGAWILVVALGVLLASVVVLTPARAKNRR